jgi:TetR/AcrR family transcriptional regulator
MNSPRSRHLPAEERKAVTVEAVIELAAHHNPSEISTTAIAQHMGVTQGALFKHFPTKAAILEAVMGWVAERLLGRIDRAAAAAPDPAAALEAVFMTHVEFVVEHPGVPRMLFGELQRSEASVPKQMAQTLLRRYGEKLICLLEEGKSQQAFAADLDTEAAALLFVGTIQGLVMQALLAGEVERIRRDAPRVFAIFLRGITKGHP